MSQYTSTQSTAGGLVINAVLNSVNNTITYTASAPNGATATYTAPAAEAGNSVTIVNALRTPLRNQNVPGTVYNGIGTALESVQVSTTQQATQAQVTAVATGNPPPAESAPIPVATANNPNTTPTPSIPPVENATAPSTGQNADAAFQEANASPQQLIDPNNDPNTNIGTEAQDLVYDPLQEPPITNDGDEFSGIDEQVQRQKDLEDGSLEFAGIDEQIGINENALQEPPLLSDEEIDQQLRLAAQGDQIENETPADITTEDPFEAARQAAEERGNEANTQAAIDAVNQSVPQGISTDLNKTRSTATKEDSANFQQKPDWRARLSLSPGADYLYKVPPEQAGILKPLQATDGVIFPYTPAISVTYSAGYDSSELIHSNYKIYQYKGSSVDTVSITADFTAQDTTEANYLLAVIHFFRSVTKMFYGQDKNPNNGVPPPLCYLSGFGAYTYDAHPVVVTNFTYSTPTDVDYIRAGSQTNQPGVNISQQKPALNTFVPSTVRKAMNGLSPKVPNFQTQNTMINSEATYIPTKLQLQITCLPIVTRNDISNKFSLKEYATGALLRGTKRSGGGIW
jgi:hypothetical protein